MENDVSLVGLLAFATLLPFIIACGTCYIKFSIVFVMVRNALGLQQIPSNMTLNGIALLLSMFVMMPVVQEGYHSYRENNVDISSVESVTYFVENGFEGYHRYLEKYSDPELARFFSDAQLKRDGVKSGSAEDTERVSILSLLPAYALSEIKSAFKIGFYLYLPFVVVDLLISSILLALGMMMMSPVTISVPIKLVLFIVLDGWSLLSKGLITQYLDLAL
ncbi:type III secretion system protein [Yersinia entomophaga]|uniref:Type III secretion system protein n=1 Tax=Yersinia entomophaga TaxID=935293 RepID=A0ABM6BQ52_YERET|nr:MULTISPECIES: EscR/YscR/HrcR family type III secretion system export apparatus protein [Yersinia]ANI31730.1 type III secretion system protein [Yersinia entomophaga]OWF85426.1 EscR/YscR/HrcR family type III secretion system export apparatus protein [Yersinia entomophaga]